MNPKTVVQVRLDPSLIPLWEECAEKLFGSKTFGKSKVIETALREYVEKHGCSKPRSEVDFIFETLGLQLNQERSGATPPSSSPPPLV